MNTLRSWREQKIMLKRRFPFLDDKDLEYEEGQKQNMLDRLALRLNKTQEDIIKIFSEMQLF